MKGISNTFLQNEALPSLDDWSPDMITPYSGSDRKEGLISPDGTRYLVKYAEAHTRLNDLDTSYVNNVISEYMSSHILGIAGFEVHHTFIGTRGGNLLVACENFTSGHQHLIEFGQYMRKHYDSGDIGRVPDIRQIDHVLHCDPVLRDYADELWASYWERFVGDALVGNFDRHMGNWGYLTDTQAERISSCPVGCSKEHPTHLSIRKNRADTLLRLLRSRFLLINKWVADSTGHFHCNKLHENDLSNRNRTAGKIYASPIYDNGSTLFPALSEKAMREDILPSEKEIMKRTLLFPKAALTVNGNKVSYLDLLSSGYEPALTQAVIKIVPVILEKMPGIRKFIDNQEFLSDTRKTFYKTMLNTRAEVILKPAYECCVSGKFNADARDRLENGIDYTENDFEQKYNEMYAAKKGDSYSL